jgi:hypothetical protein
VGDVSDYSDAVLTAFREWDGLVSGDHDHLAECGDTHIFQITNPFRGRPLFWIRCEHAFTAEFQLNRTIRP